MDAVETNNLTLQYALLGCKYCKSKYESNNKENSNKIMRLLFEPLNISQKNLKDWNQLDECFSDIKNLQKLFLKPDNYDTELSTVFKLINYKNKEERKKFQRFTSIISEYTYLEFIKHLILQRANKIIETTAILFIYENADTFLSGLRVKSLYRSGKKFEEINFEKKKDLIFSDIGYSLDEGMAEHLGIIFVNTMLNREDDDVKSSVYYFERRIIQKLFKNDKDLLLKAFYEGEMLKLTYTIISRTDNPCDFYDLFHLSDSCKWIETNMILNKLE